MSKEKNLKHKLNRIFITEESELNVITKYVKIYLFVRGISLSELPIKVLSYFILYGINDKSISYLFDFKIVKSKAQIANFLSFYRKHKLTIKEKDSKEEVICNELNFNNFDLKKSGFLISIKMN